MKRTKSRKDKHFNITTDRQCDQTLSDRDARRSIFKWNRKFHRIENADLLSKSAITERKSQKRKNRSLN